MPMLMRNVQLPLSFAHGFQIVSVEIPELIPPGTFPLAFQKGQDADAVDLVLRRLGADKALSDMIDNARECDKQLEGV